MKYLIFILLFVSNVGFACIVAPQKIQPSPELGFDIKEEHSNLCENCSMISIASPMEYDGRPASHAIFSVFQNGELISKTISAFKEESKKAEFVGIVTKEKGFSYEVSIEYGAGRCMGYKFVVGGSDNGS